MINQVQPLVITPFPKPGESLAGLVLRTSEMNGYETPNNVLRHAGMTENEIRSIWPPIDKLAQLYARSSDNFSSMGYLSLSVKKRRKEWLLLNQVVPALYTNVKASKVCPECILEHGYVEGYWELRHAVACPVHRRMAITTCPSCGDTLRWNRPGLLQCKCGQNLSDLRGEQVNDAAVLDMLALIKAKLHGNMAGTQRLIDRGFPLSELENISFSTLISIVGRFGLRRKRNRQVSLPEGISDEIYALHGASKSLARWPYGLYDYLESLPSESRKISSFNLQRQFHQFFCSMFKSGMPEDETAFLRKAFVSFGNERWQKNGFIDIRLANRAQESRHIVGIDGLAEHLNVMPPTIRKYIKKGLIKGIPLTCGKRERKIFDLRDVPFKRSEGKYHKQRDAAKFLGLPVELLRLLRKTGTYKVTRLAWGLDGYSELDLNEFRDNLVNMAPVVSDHDPRKHLSMNKILRMKLGGPEVSARIIGSILNSEIIPAGRTGNAIGDVMFNKIEILNILQSCRWS